MRTLHFLDWAIHDTVKSGLEELGDAESLLKKMMEMKRMKDAEEAEGSVCNQADC